MTSSASSNEASNVQLPAVTLGEVGDSSLPIAGGDGGHAPDSPRLASCKTHVLPSGSLKSANEP